MKLSDPRLNTAVFLGATLLVFGTLVALSKFPQLQVFKRGREYRTVFENVSGLNQGDEVRYAGLRVGAVTDLRPDSSDPTRVVVTFRVRRDTRVLSDARTSITQVGMLGEPFLNIQPVSRTAPPAPEGATLASINSLSFQQAMSQLALFFQRTDTLLINVTKMTEGNPVARLESTLARIDQLINTTSASTGRLVGQLENTSAQLNRVLEHSDRVMAAVDTLI